MVRKFAAVSPQRRPARTRPPFNLPQVTLTWYTGGSHALNGPASGYVPTGSRQKPSSHGDVSNRTHTANTKAMATGRAEIPPYSAALQKPRIGRPGRGQLARWLDLVNRGMFVTICQLFVQGSIIHHLLTPCDQSYFLSQLY